MGDTDLAQTVIAFPALALLLLMEGVLQWKYLGTDHKTGLAGCVVIIYCYIVMVRAAPSSLLFPCG